MFVNVHQVGLTATTMFMLHNQMQKLHQIATFRSPTANFISHIKSLISY